MRSLRLFICLGEDLYSYLSFLIMPQKDHEAAINNSGSDNRECRMLTVTWSAVFFSDFHPPKDWRALCLLSSADSDSCMAAALPELRACNCCWHRHQIGAE